MENERYHLGLRAFALLAMLCFLAAAAAYASHEANNKATVDNIQERTAS